MIFYVILILILVAGGAFLWFRRQKKDPLFILLTTMTKKIFSEISRLEKTTTNSDLAKMIARVEMKIDDLRTKSREDVDIFNPDSSGDDSKSILIHALTEIIEKVEGEKTVPLQIEEIITRAIDARRKYWKWGFLQEAKTNTDLIKKLQEILKYISSLTDRDLGDPLIFQRHIFSDEPIAEILGKIFDGKEK